MPQTTATSRTTVWRRTGLPAVWLLCAFLSLAMPSHADRMCSDTSANNTSDTLTDSGGNSNDYSNNENCTFTIATGSPITLSFSAFNYETGWDFLRIYDGPSAASPLLGSFTGSSVPADVTASSGSMTIVHSSDSSITRSGFVASWNSTGSSCPAETVGDDFPNVSYNQNSGSENWDGDWEEIGESDGPSSGISRVNNSLCSNGNCLRIGEPSTARSWTNRGAERAVDLSGAGSATLSYVFRTGWATGTETVTLDISSNGGSTWSTLRTWTVTSSQFSGTAESFNISAYASANTRIRFLSSGTNARVGLYVDDILINYQPPCTPSVVAEWRFDESAWNGTADEVEDTQGSGIDATAVNGATSITDGFLCRGGRFDGTNDYLNAPGIDATLRTTASLSFWLKTNQVGDSINWLAPGISGGELSGGTNDIFWGWINNNGRVGITVGDGPISVSTTAVNNSNWHHVVVTRDAGSGSLRTYVDGNLEASTTAATGTIATAFSSIARIEDTAGTHTYYRGDLDELVMFDEVLSAAEVQDIYDNQRAGNNWDGTARSCPANGAAALEITHDSSGIHCAAEAVTVRALDASDAVVTNYSEVITLDTGSGTGTWTLVTGNGTLTDATANDGVATYQFSASDGGSATFALSYTEGVATIDIDAWQVSDTNVRDDDTEGTLTFAPSGFTLTANALSNPPPDPINDPLGTQVAGNDFTVHIAAYGTTPTDSSCGVIETYTGAHTLDVWQDYVDPVSGSVTATVNGSAVGSASGTATSQAVTFTAGQSSVIVRYRDSGEIRLHMRDDTSFSNTLTGATNTFVVRPADLVVSAVTDAALNPNPAATAMTDTGFVAAGTPFRVVVTARDSLGGITPNFGLESAPESVKVRSDVLIAPTGGRNGSTGDLLNGGGFIRTAAGTFTSTAVVFDEVGIIRLRATIADDNFLTAGQVTGSQSGNVGRFFPADFALTGGSVTPACSSFTYEGQPALRLAYTINARNALGATTENYDTPLIGSGGVAAVLRVAENADSGTDLGSRLSTSLSTWNAGVFTDIAPNTVFSRSIAPDGPFDALQIGVQVFDALDGRTLSVRNMNPATSGSCATAGNCTAQTLGGTTSVRWGRLLIADAYASEDTDLMVPLRAEYWDGSSFRFSNADQCTTYAAADTTLSAYTDNLAFGDTAVTGPGAATPLAAGETDVSNPLLLSAPGFGKDGSVAVTLDVPSWLEFDWNGAGATDPSGVQTFGRLRGHDRIVYWEELTR